MIAVTDIQQLATDIQDYVGGIDHTVIAADERHLIKRLHDKKGKVLAVSLPASDSSALDVNNYSDRNNIFLFILEKAHPDMKELDEMAQYQGLQIIAKGIKEFIIDKKEAGSEFFAFANESRIRTEPEYNVFGGYNGYSIGFELKDFEY
jgi:hypothetical protein